MILQNLTSNKIILTSDLAEIITIPPSGIVADCSKNFKIVDKVYIDNKPVTISKTVYGKVSNLPEYKEGVLNIVYKHVAKAAKTRKDLVYPHLYKHYPMDSEDICACIGLYTAYDDKLL